MIITRSPQWRSSKSAQPPSLTTVYCHPSRIAVFAGDFIDRGPKQMAVLRITRDMVEIGFARAIMGNHEFNAIAWAIPDVKGGAFASPHIKEPGPTS